MNYFITAIGTDSGKTLVSAIVVQALGADYWKPIQAGRPTDSDSLRKLISNNSSTILKERYVLNTPASPHMAAALDQVTIQLADFEIPEHNSEHLVIEGAGGILVPINEKDFVIDLAESFNAEIILVCDLYLGSINHSLLTIQELKRRALPIKGIIFNGDPNPDSERVILNAAEVPLLLHIEREEEINSQIVEKYALRLKQTL